MNCSEVKERLSAYHDGELPPEEAAQVAAHLADCSSCAEELASFEHLSGLSRRLTDPPVPAHLWDELQAQLDAGEISKVLPWQPWPTRIPGTLVALAAAVLLALGVGIFFSTPRHADENEQLTANFASYLEDFAERPEKAQRVLLTKYEGRPATLAEAANELGYEPLAAMGLPAGYSLENAYLLKMPCCTCAQVVCKNRRGKSIAIFEHNVDQPMWFGDRPSINCVCQDMPTSVTQVGDRLAASWKAGKRYITVIGASDLDEVSEFVAHFSGSGSKSG